MLDLGLMLITRQNLWANAIGFSFMGGNGNHKQRLLRQVAAVRGIITH